MDGIAKTSLLVAALRAQETKRSDLEGRLFSDPYAEILSGSEGFKLMEKGIEAAGDQPAIAIRTYFIDQQINKALDEGVRQIVILAAGMDARAYRLKFPKNSLVFELDKKEVLKYKEERLKDIPVQCKRISIAVDLREEWAEELLKKGFKKSQRTLWLVEGLVMYLAEEQVVSVIQKINSLATSKDILLMDILGRSLLDSPFMKNQLLFLKSIDAPWQFGTDEPEVFLKQLGWEAQVYQSAEVAPQRWPFPLIPRDVPNVPRGFFVQAYKN